MSDRTSTTSRWQRAVIAALATATATAGLAAPASAGSDPGDGVPDVCAAAPVGHFFEDVGVDDPVSEAVSCLAHARITTGVGAGRYAPGQDVTRAQMASFLARTADLASVLDPDDHIAVLPADFADFVDLDHSGPHAANVGRLAEAGIATGGPGGLPDEQYAPGQPVSRAQMASFVRRTIEFVTGTTMPAGTDQFDDDDGDAHESAVDALARAGIVHGYDDGSYRPGATVNRGAMALYLTRTLRYLHVQGAIDRLPATLPPIGNLGSAVVDRWGDLGPLEAVAPNGGEDGAAGSGCRPGSDEHLPDGIWMAEITDVTSSDVGLDLVCFQTQESADIDFDYEIIDDSDLVRRMPVAANAHFFLMTYPPVVLIGTPVEHWRFDDPLAAGDFLVDRGYHDDPGVSLAWVLIEDGAVAEVYTPPWTSA